MKKLTIAFILMTVCLLAGCGAVALNIPGYAAGGSSDGNVITPEGEINTTEEALKTDGTYAVDESVSGAEDYMENILESADSAFLCGYAVDEGFLSYILAKYGEDALRQLSEKASLGDPEEWYNVTGRSIHALFNGYCLDNGITTGISQLYHKNCASSETVTMAFTGDINLADNMGTVNYMEKNGLHLSDCFDEAALSELAGADILVVNNECSLSTRGEPLSGKAFTFRGKPERASELLTIGTDLAGIANNHIYDYGPDALLDTVEALNSAGIPTAGAGANIKEASAPVYFEANGRVISVVAATQIERSYSYTKEATDTTPGVLKSLIPAKTVEAIRKAKKNSDYCIVFIHWGTEGDASFGGDQKNLAIAYKDAGADAVIGGHTHCLQGMGYIDDMPVAFSLGNFWFASTANLPGAYDTGIAKLQIAKDGEITLSFVPCRFSGGKVSVLTDESAEKLIKYVSDLSYNAALDENGVLIKK